jgi:hypothetical protein
MLVIDSVPLGPVMLSVTCSRVSWVTGSMTSLSAPQVSVASMSSRVHVQDACVAFSPNCSVGWLPSMM